MTNRKIEEPEIRAVREQLDEWVKDQLMAGADERVILTALAMSLGRSLAMFVHNRSVPLQAEQMLLNAMTDTFKECLKSFQQGDKTNEQYSGVGRA